MDIEPITQSTAAGITSLIEYGALGSMATIGVGVSVLLVWAILKQLKECSETTRASVNRNSDVIETMEKNTTAALNGLQLVLVELRAEMRSRPPNA